MLGADARVLMATMGWTSMALVQRYTHMVPEIRRDVAERQATLWQRATEPSPDPVASPQAASGTCSR